MKVELHFVLEKETKGAVRYKEVNENGFEVSDPKIGTLYIRKSALSGIPAKLRVSVEEE